MRQPISALISGFILSGRSPRLLSISSISSTSGRGATRDSFINSNTSKSGFILSGRSFSAATTRQQQRKLFSLIASRSPRPLLTHSALVSFKFKQLSCPLSTMPPIPQDHSQFIDETINGNEYVIFSKTTCSYCVKAKDLFKSLGVKYTEVVLDKVENGEAIHDVLIEKINRKTVPQIFIRGRHIGGYMDILQAQEIGLLKNLIRQHPYEYDLVVIGGGSGGLAASKQAAQMGMKVAVLDYVVPTPRGTAWGLGGTCVNVGCIPKKLMHQAAQAGETLKDSYHYGWETANGEALVVNQNIKNNWMHLREEVQNYIKSTNFQYRVQLRQEHVNYINAYGTFVDSHTIKTIDKNKKESQITADKIIIATGERPRYPDIEGAREYCITSDDVFSLPYPPGKTLVVGASYVALECAGFLHGLGFDTTVMVRSILLRGFDQEMAEKVGDYMKHEGVKFIRPCVPTKIEQIEAGEPGRLRVTAAMQDGTVITDEYNTVLLAIGRDPCTDKIGLENVGVNRNPKSGKLPTTEEQTNVPNIYAIGDVLEGKSELTPVAIQAGKLLARRLFTNSKELCDYVNVATTVFTPLEYSCVGYSEEKAISKFGDEKVEVYIQCFVPVGWTLTKRPLNVCYAKLITLKGEKEKVLGFHYFGPYAGEIIQLAALALKKECTKDELDSLIAVHPTCAEMFTMLTVTKRSGLSAAQKGCCG